MERVEAGKRKRKEDYYLDIAEEILGRGTCLRRVYGAVVVNKDTIVSTGYTGAPRGAENCNDRGVCRREELAIPSGERYELCRSVHAEANAVINGSRESMIGGTLYLTGKDMKTGEILEKAECCSMCKRLIVNAGIKRVVGRTGKEGYEVIEVKDWVKDL